MSGDKPEDNKDTATVAAQKPSVISASEPPSNNKKTKEKPAAKKSGGSNVLGLLALLIALGALVLAGWMY